MHSLIKMSLYRFRRSRLFKVCLALSFIAGVVFGIINAAGAWDGRASVDDMFIVPLFLIECGFISLMIGGEYSDGTVRNKVIAGKPRAKIYAANAIIGIIVAVTFTTLFIIPAGIIGWNCTFSYLATSDIIKTLTGFYFLNAAFCALFVSVSSLIASREVGVLVNLVLLVGIMFTSYQMEFVLGQDDVRITYTAIESVEMTPEEVAGIHDGTFSGSYWYEEDGDAVTYYKDIVTEESVPNPKAARGISKKVLEHADRMLPYGQLNAYVAYISDRVYAEEGAEISDDYRYVSYLPLYSVIFMIFSWTVGIFGFRKKDMK